MMKDLLISLLQTISAKLKDKDCVISDDVALDLIALGEKLVEDNNPISKTEASDLLHCSTKTVERLVAEGLLHKGRKRPGHSTLYWKRADITECKRTLKKLGRKLGDK